jgi:hypothetical protein
LEVLHDSELSEDRFGGGGAVLCDAEALDVGGDVGVEVLAVGERFEIDVGDAADSCLGCNDAAGGEVEMGDRDVCVERRSGGVRQIDGSFGAITCEPPPGTCALSLNGEAAVGETLVSSALSCW